MPRSYRHIQEYEKEIIELREQGLTGRQIQEKFDNTKTSLQDTTEDKIKSQPELH